MKQSVYTYYKYNSENENILQYNYMSECMIERGVSMKLQISKKITSLHHFLFWLFSFGRFCEYQVVCGGKIVAFAQVCSRIFIFGFMPHGKNAIHIGPCYTHPDFRGQGLYTFLLASICSNFSKNKKYIFCHKDNIPSKRGILKVGFIPYAEGYKSKFGIYKINRYLLDKNSHDTHF